MRKFQRFPPFRLPTATLERGEAKYFHGREKILGNFKGLMDRAVQAKAGTTVMIQTASGRVRPPCLLNVHGWHGRDVGRPPRLTRMGCIIQRS